MNKNDRPSIADMATIHRDVGARYGKNGHWEAILFLAHHIGHLMDDLDEAKKEIKRLRRNAVS